MSSYVVEVNEELNRILTEKAAARGMSVEKLITALLHRFALDTHSMKVEDLKDGYESVGEINLEWANLK